MKASLGKTHSEFIEIKVEVGTCSLPSKAEEIVIAFKRELSRLEEEGIGKSLVPVEKP